MQNVLHEADSFRTLDKSCPALDKKFSHILCLPWPSSVCAYVPSILCDCIKGMSFSNCSMVPRLRSPGINISPCKALGADSELNHDLKYHKINNILITRYIYLYLLLGTPIIQEVSNNLHQFQGTKIQNYILVYIYYINN